MPKHEFLAIMSTLIFITLLLIACDGGDIQLLLDENAPNRPSGWTEKTHGDSADPSYEVVFPDDEVNRIDIKIDPADWQVMWDDMTANYGEFGTRQRMGGPAGGQNGAPPGQKGAPGQPGQDGLPQGMGGVGSNPVWVPCTIEFEGKTWNYVGVRFKGNSSLFSSWGASIMKLPFKLDFDEFEDDHHEIENQRFYGFKQLSLSNGFNDSSLLREKISADIFREAGVPAAHTAFYRVYVDYGGGPTYFGLYTMVEVVDDTVISDQFKYEGGNLYKPEGPGASFAYGTFSETVFEKETNEEVANWDDVLALFDALHSPLRSTDPATWRTNLATVLDVDGFLKWLAVNTVIQNWDTYGTSPHNYYLYNDPDDGLLTWIPWDNNETLREGHSNMGGTLSIGLDEVDDRWPLIRFLMDDEVYRAKYVNYVEEVIDGAFEPSMMEARYRELHALIAPYVVGEEGEVRGYTHLKSPQEFKASLDQLIEHVNSRYAAAEGYINSQ